MLRFFMMRASLDTRSSFAIVALAAIAVVASSALVIADCFVGPNGCKYGITNPCTINVCMSSDFLCSDGSAMNTKIVMPPPSWQVCQSYSGFASWTCSEAETMCGTTQAFYDNGGCNSYCDGTSAWYACLATGNYCGGGN
jgi:hypothetical protein